MLFVQIMTAVGACVVIPFLYGWWYDRCAPQRLEAQRKALDDLKRRMARKQFREIWGRDYE